MTIQEVKKAHDIVNVVEAYGITLQPKGVEFVGMCPFHQDSRPSLYVNRRKQVFGCFACDSKGDVIDFVVLKEGCTPMEAAQRIAGNKFEKPIAASAPPPKKQGTPVEWKQFTPAPKPGQILHHEYGAPTRTWDYHDASGNLLGLICRFDPPAGKQILPYTYRVDGGGRKMWQWRGFDRPRPLYNLPGLSDTTKKSIVVVEGEKTADAAATLLQKAAVTCWQGGANAWRVTDLEPLRGRVVILWPDNDMPGLKAMRELGAELAGKFECKVKICVPPQDKPNGWDLADAKYEGWTADEARVYTLANVHTWDNPIFDPSPAPDVHEVPAPPAPAPPPVQEVAPPVPTPPPPEDVAPQVPKNEQAQPLDEFRDNQYFTVLGFVKESDKQQFAFYVKSARTVVMYSASGLGSKSNLLTLAPLFYWEDQYPENGKRKGGFSIDMALQTLVESANRCGVFSTKYLRGRGAWFDANRVVLHVGAHLIVNGTEMPLGALASRYVYEAGEALDVQITNPLHASEANKVMDIMRLINWERDINAFLLAGWCVIAPVCGALRWRPHIWITGSAGTGKSWVFRELVRRLLGATCLAVQSETSEAGLRQYLGSDAMPVIFDEAEAETRAAIERMEHVLALMRASSSNDGGVVAKGSGTGVSKTFVIRSCFAFASINSPVSLQSDRTRITQLVLVEPTPEVRAQRWQLLQKLHAEILTEDFVRRLQARTVKLLPTILKNADVFAAAAAAHLGQQRIGDQLGALLAGAYSLHSDGAVTYDKALAFIADKNWNEEKLLDGTKDEMALFAYIMDKSVRVDGLGAAPVERNLGELIRIAAGLDVDSVVHVSAAQERLKRLGFKVAGDYIMISNTSDALRVWLRETPWAKNHHRTLLRLPGGEALASERFASGVNARAVKLPLGLLKF